MSEKQTWLRFAPDNAVGVALEAWWRDLHEQRRGERAALRRAFSLEEAVCSGDIEALRAFYRLGDAVAAAARAADMAFFDTAGRAYSDRDRLWPIAVLLAEVRPERNHGAGSGTAEALPRSMRKSVAQREACISEQRFKRLLNLDTPTELLRPLRRALALLEQAGLSVDVFDLANALWRWDERRRKAWAYAYFAQPAAPVSE